MRRDGDAIFSLHGYPDILERKGPYSYNDNFIGGGLRRQIVRRVLINEYSYSVLIIESSCYPIHLCLTRDQSRN